MFSEFDLQPESQGILLGSDLILHCSASDVPVGRDLVYEWQFEGESINTSIPRASQFTNHSLFVPRVTHDELGNYRCVVAMKETPEVNLTSQNATVLQACKLLFKLL